MTEITSTLTRLMTIAGMLAALPAAAQQPLNQPPPQLAPQPVLLLAPQPLVQLAPPPMLHGATQPMPQPAPQPIVHVATQPLLQLTAQAPQPAPQPTQRPVQPGAPAANGIEWISIVVLVGQQEAATGADDIPPAVRNALADVREFLPFKSYRMYDAALVRPPNRPTSSSNAWLRGTGTQVLEARLITNPGAPGPLDPQAPFSATFALREPQDPANRKSEHDAPLRTLMNTPVTLRAGETVVVGTSRLRGDTALIVLLTAVPAKR